MKEYIEKEEQINVKTPMKQKPLISNLHFLS